MFGGFTLGESSEYLQMTQTGKLVLVHMHTDIKPKTLSRRQAQRWFREHQPPGHSWKDAIHYAEEWRKENSTK